MPISDLTLAVVGANHPNKRGPTRRFAIACCKPGDPVQLVPEPKNPADPRAIQVQNEAGVVMGYITAERCGWIGGMLAAGRELCAVFQESTKYGALIRVTLDGNLPDLPPERFPDDPPNQDEPDWWPDEEPPDE